MQNKFCVSSSISRRARSNASPALIEPLVTSRLIPSSRLVPSRLVSSRAVSCRLDRPAAVRSRPVGGSSARCSCYTGRQFRRGRWTRVTRSVDRRTSSTGAEQSAAAAVWAEREGTARQAAVRPGRSGGGGNELEILVTYSPSSWPQSQWSGDRQSSAIFSLTKGKVGWNWF